MDIPISWLKDFVDIKISILDLAEKLTMAGIEVEAIKKIGEHWEKDKYFIGELTEIKPHPNADRLCLATVNYGNNRTTTIVTGAPNILKYLGKPFKKKKVALAIEGAKYWDPYSDEPKQIRLKKATIRGIPSNAMVLSEKELGISDNHEGILYLPDDAPTGTPLYDWLGDTILEIDVKGGFGYLQSILGIAREIAALTNSPIKKESLAFLNLESFSILSKPEYLVLEIKDPKLCPRYTAFMIKDIKVKESPFWMKQRLIRAGMRPINNIVDITNYVMLELGQPLHAFDYEVLNPKLGENIPAIIVRRAFRNETITTLDGEKRDLDEDMLLITDGEGPVAVAGVMGGLESEITDTTTNVLLEAANFNFINIRRTSQLLKIKSEASSRFGRGVDPELTIMAGMRAAKLMEELADGHIEPVIGDLYPGKKKRKTIRFSPELADRVLGVKIDQNEMLKILSSLEFKVQKEKNDIFIVTPPSYRLDINEPIDLVEEIGRIWGYNRMPSTLIKDELPPQRGNENIEFNDKVRDILTGCGLDEVITYSIINIEDEAKLFQNKPPFKREGYIKLLNPLSTDRAYLRKTLIPNLLHTIKDNLRFEKVAIFEIGSLYLPQNNKLLPNEPFYLGIAMTGPKEKRSWLSKDEKIMDFFDIKGVIEALFTHLDILDVIWEPSDENYLSPGRGAKIIINGEVVGNVGELHPEIALSFDLPEQPILISEINLEKLRSKMKRRKTIIPISPYPPVYEDLA
ncbi:MAG: phenylalanine--tRNA ligase subunit beta, partial [Deltaproteobacteria bacterium]|nr:phenylalanine--tRNA ligase subunit beta [Deltaproteobacteria bacterium]